MAYDDSIGPDTASLAHTSTGYGPTAPVLTDAERLDVYRVALDAHRAVVSLAIGEHRILRDQLERASLSVALNISEGAGLRGRREKRRHYSIARGSAMECVAALDVVKVRGLVAAQDVELARRLNVRVIQMLTLLDRALA
jgi:four helix bundle protein